MKIGGTSLQGHLPFRSGSTGRECSQPAEALDWRLPSGQGLVEFALQSGFLAPFLMDSSWPVPRPHSCTAPAAKAAEIAARVRG